MLSLNNLSVELKGESLLSNITFTIAPGTVQVCMGANGSGKSSLAATLMGHPHYQVTGGSIRFLGEDITYATPDYRAKKGIFLSLQQPFAIPGVSFSALLKESFRALHGADSLDLYVDRLTQALTVLNVDPHLLQRPLYEGFSGGEKKKCEMVQLLVLQPKLAILDEVDSGLDADALKRVASALLAYKKLCPEASLLIITHYQRLLTLLVPDQVVVMKEGTIEKQGGPEIISSIEKTGYEK